MTAMTLQIPRGEHVPTADQRVVMSDISWDQYEALLAIRGPRPRPRMAYLDGALELMTTSEDHERIKKWIACIVEAYMLEIGIVFGGYGSWTMTQRPKKAGAEADECYRIGADQTKGRSPDLALEVVWTHGGIDKLEIYRRLGVREVWFWDDGEIHIYELGANDYERRDRSAFLPDLDLALVCRLVELPTINDAVHALRSALRR